MRVPVLSWLMVHMLGTLGLGAPMATAKPWLEMDYGPYKATTVEAPKPAGNFAFKGITIKLADDASVLFDTDTLRYAAGWDGWLHLSSVVYDGKHWAYPKTDGPIRFATPMAPGWAKPGTASRDGKATPDFADTRFKGKDGRRYGPLDAAWGRWRGLYVHGQRVVLRYEVGDVAVLETPGLETHAGARSFTRTLNIAAAKTPTRLLATRIAMIEPGMKVLDRGKGQGKGGVVSWVIIGHPTQGDAKGETAPEQSTDATADPTADPALKKGLVAHWTFDAIDGDKIADAAGSDGADTLHVKGVKLASGYAGKALSIGSGSATVADSKRLKLGRSPHTLAAWVKTKHDGSVIARAAETGRWSQQGRSLFIRGGRLTMDVGWVGELRGKKRITDNRWRHVAVTFDPKTSTYKLYVDGQTDGSKQLDVEEQVESHVVKIGHTSADFPSRNNRFRGLIDDVRVYNRVLSAREISKLGGAGGVVQPGDDDEPAGGEAFVLTAVTDKASANPQWAIHDGVVTLTLDAKQPARIKAMVARCDAAKASDVAKASMQTAAPEDLTPLTQGGKAKWTQTVSTKGTAGSPRGDGAWAIDTITAPDKNPWNSWMRFGGFDFFTSDKSKAAICTWSGDVWVVEGIKGDLSELTWRRIAAGMFQPLGLKIVNDVIYVTCRDQITRLHDLNGDGETDYYEAFNHDHQVTEHFHEFAMDLQTDDAGNFYYAKSARHARDSLVEQHGTLIRVSPDGKTSEILANGYRAANGVGLGPGGVMFTSDQEGHWMPANRINLVKPGSFSGNMFSYHRGEKPTDYDRPLVWLPKGIDRSPAAQVWVDSDKWGLPRGSLVSTSYGTGSLLNVMYEPVKGHPRAHVQGAFVKLPLQFPTGVMRGRFHPVDGQLYACGLFGWSSNRTRPGGFYRVRYTGKPVRQPIRFEVKKDAIVLGFTDPLDRELATDPESYAVQQWNYQWSGKYGSAEYRLSNPGQKGRDTTPVRAAALSEDGKTLTLSMPGLKPSMQVRIQCDLDTADGKGLSLDIYGSIFKVPSP